jgi:hypothetical protein
MAKLTTKQRKALPSRDFALEKQRKYPIQDRGHAIAAKSRAKQQLDKGNLSKAQYNEIIREADAKLKGDDKRLDKEMAKDKKKPAAKKAAAPKAKASAAKKAAPKKKEDAAKKDELVRGAKARTNKGFQQNMRVMEGAGYSKKRAIGTAYGEANSPARPKAKPKAKPKAAAKPKAKAAPKTAAKKIAAKRKR